MGTERVARHVETFMLSTSHTFGDSVFVLFSIQTDIPNTRIPFLKVSNRDQYL